MRRLQLALAVVPLLALNAANAQDQTCAVSGVVGALAGAPLPDVQVSSTRAGSATQTDSAGRFRLSGLPCGSHEIQVRKIGFTVRRDTIDLQAGQEATRIYGMISVALLDTMTVSADEIHYHVPRLRDFEKRRKERIAGHFISESDLRKAENVAMSSLLRRVPGLQTVHYNGAIFVKSGRGIGSTEGEDRLDPRPGSPRGCWVAVYVDGHMLFDGRIDHKMMIKPPDVGQYFAMNLSGIEYYGSGGSMPIQFKNTKTSCGALLFWTRGR